MTEPQKKMRLFVAVDIPRPLLEEIAVATERLREEWPEARWTPLENQHITLKFLGWVEPIVVDDVVRSIEEAAAKHRPAAMEPGLVGVFPSARRARVLWVGVSDAADLLASLVADLEEVLEPLGFEREQRRFTAHLTLARFRTPRSVVGEPAIGSSPSRGSFEVDRIVLYRSHLSPKGPRYEALQAFPLGGSGGGPSPQTEK